MVNEDRTLLAMYMQHRQKNWLDLALRHDSLLTKVNEGRMDGKKTPGSPISKCYLRFVTKE